MKKKQKDEIRKSVLQTVVKKREFCINCFDIVDKCFSIGITDEIYLDKLINWINDKQSVFISKDELKGYLEKKSNAKIDDSLDIEVIEIPLIEYNQEVVLDLNESVVPKINRIRVEAFKFNRSKSIKIAAMLMILISTYFMNVAYKQYNHKSQSLVIKNVINKDVKNFKKSEVANVVFDKVPNKEEVIKTIDIKLNEIKGKKVHNKSDKRLLKSNFIKKDLISTTTKNVATTKIVNLTYTNKNQLEGKYRYSKVDEEILKDYLKEMNSLLAEDKYLKEIMSAAKNFDISPLLILAIAGQEQSFVPRSNKYANQIVNNPFNVYGSWKKFNTNLSDACTIVSRTIISLSGNKPQGVNQIKWINRRYADDNDWWVGVNGFFEQLYKTVVIK